MMVAVNEQPVLFGRSMSLFGIVSRPTPHVAIRQPAVVILNTGIVHRVGHHRIYVTMARELAALGHVVFRFDFSGIGDSANRGGSFSPLEACQADVSEALDWLTASCDTNEVVLVGLCSGANVALSYGHTDRRVVGLVLLDPTIPPTARFYARYIARRITQFRSWRSFTCGRGRIWQDLTERLSRAFGTRLPAQPVSPNDPRVRSELEKMYLKSLDRDLKLLFVLTDGREGRQCYREQLFEAFPNVPFKGKVSLEYFREADHTFTSESVRARLQELVAGWINTTPFSRVPEATSVQRNETKRLSCAG